MLPSFEAKRIGAGDSPRGLFTNLSHRTTPYEGVPWRTGMNAPAPLLLQVFPTFDVGGAQMRFTALANRFGRSARHLVVAMDGRTGCRQLLDPDLDVRYLTVAVRKNALLGNIAGFRNVVRTYRPDILVTRNWGSIEWALARAGTGVRHVHIEDGFGPEEADGQFARRKLARRLLLRRSVVVVPSQKLQTIARREWGIAPARLRYIPNGIDVERFAALPRPSSASGTAVIGTVCALRPEKDVGTLIRCFAEVARDTPCRLVITGDGTERESLQELARAQGVADHVEFTGAVSDTTGIYGTLDVFALTSKTEQMPYTILEAMASRCAIVATDVGDVAAMVSRENGPFIVPRQEATISTALNRLLQNPSLRADLGEANLRVARERFTEAAMVRNYAELYGIKMPPRTDPTEHDRSAGERGA